MSTQQIKKGQNFRFGFYDEPPEQRLAAIRDAGFDETMFWWGVEFEATDGSRLKLFDTATRLGLEVNTCHFPSTHSDHLWYGGEVGDSYVKQFDEACRECGERGIANLVLHLTRRTITPEPNEYGFVNFERMLDSAEKYGVTIALENTRFLRYNDVILQHFASQNIGFCFDSGHANCYTPNEQPLEKYGKMLVTTHLHDNEGATGSEKPDQHHLMGEGTVNFDKVFDGLKKFNAKHLNLESYCNESSRYFGKLTCERFLQLSYETLSKQMKKSGLI